MKKFITVIISFFLVVEVFSQNIVLRPTKGFNEFTFGVSKAREVKAYFSNIQFEEKIGGAVSCGDADPMRHQSITLTNDSIGIQFYFSSSWVENSKMQEPCLGRIVLTKNVGFFLDNTVEIGKSNLNSIKKIYGEEKGRDRVKYALLYEELGLHFIFDAKGILRRVQLKQVDVK